LGDECGQQRAGGWVFTPYIDYSNIRCLFSVRKPTWRNQTFSAAGRTVHANMKQNRIPLSQQYVTTLESHLKQGPRAGFLPALKLGRQAVALGLETLDLARIHEQAMATLNLSNIKNAFTKLAGNFFAEANTAIEETHLAARQTREDLSKLMATLDRRTQELAVSNRQLQKGSFGASS